MLIITKACLNPNHIFVSWKFTGYPILQVYSHLHSEVLECVTGPPKTYTILLTSAFLQKLLLFKSPYFNISNGMLALSWMVIAVVQNWGRPNPITEAQYYALLRGPSATITGIKGKMVRPKATSMCEQSDTCSVQYVILLSIVIL